MEFPDNREEEIMIEAPSPPKEKLPDRDRGIVCKWCKTRGRNVVRKTYANNIRTRFCLACRREFMTSELVG